MMRRYAQFNPKRRLVTPAEAESRVDELEQMAQRVGYGGNPEHKIHVDDISLTKSQEIWAQTVRDGVHVSAYPLAMWLASSWWRLNHEPLPTQQPGHDWRMSHELGAANHGYVWPRVVFVPDGEAIHVWAGASMTPQQSVQYLQSLDGPRLVPMAGFQASVSQFIQSAIARLDAAELAGTPLAQLWAALQDDLANPEAARRRKLEAELGFDPEECPDQMLDAALQWESRVGATALSELAPASSSAGSSPDLKVLGELANANGLIGNPELTPDVIDHHEQGAPWERAVHDAQALRRKLTNIAGPMPNHQLHHVLGLSTDAVSRWAAPQGGSPVAVVMPSQGDGLRFVPRKRNAVAQRFELARFLGEYLRPSSSGGDRWLVSTDLATSRQKYQRAFAAEFLCPINALTSFLNGDFSSYAIEAAAYHFEVSEQVIGNLLLNNGIIHQHWTGNMPYRMAG